MLMRSPLQGITRHPLRAPRLPSVIQQAIAVLRRSVANAHVCQAGISQVGYGQELITTQFTSLAGYVSQTGCSVAIVGDEVELTATQTGVCFVDTPTVTTSVGSQYFFSVLARYSGSAGGFVYLGAAMASVPYSSPTTSATSVPITLTPTSENALVRLRLRIDATAIGQKAYFKLGSVRQQITSSTVANGLPAGAYASNDGSTGFGVVDGSCGLLLDGLGVLGADVVTNGSNPSTTTGWSQNAGGSPTLSATGGAFVCNSGTLSNVLLGQGVPTTVGQWYIASADVSAHSSTSAIYVGASIGSAGDCFGLQTSAIGTKYGIFKASQTTSYVQVAGAGASATGIINNITCRPISGNPVSQANAANRPTIRRGSYNLLLNSVLAGGTSGALGSGAVAPTNWPFGFSSGTVTFSAESVRFQATAQRPFLNQVSINAVAGTTYTYSMKVLAGDGVTAINGLAVFNPATAVLSALTYKRNGVAATGAEIVVAGDVLSYTAACTTSGTYQLRFGLGVNGSATGDVTLSQPQLEIGTTAGDYTPTTTAGASNQTAGKFWLDCDGANDSLYSSVAPFNPNDDWFMCSAFRVNDVSNCRVALHGSVVGNNAQGPKLMVAQTTGYVTLECYDGTTWASIPDTVSCVGQVVVVWATQVAGVRKLWKNGALIGSNSQSLTPLTGVGMRISGSGSVGASFFSGMLGPQEAVKGTFSDQDALTMARAVAANTLGAPSF